MFCLAGVSSLSESELQAACELRGIPVRRSSHRMALQRQMNDWLTLSANSDIPLSLLVMSRAFAFTDSGTAKNIEHMLSSMPAEVVDELQTEEDDSQLSRDKKLEMIKRQEALIIEENKLIEEQKNDKPADFPPAVTADEGHTQGVQGSAESLSTDAKPNAKPVSKKSPRATSAPASETSDREQSTENTDKVTLALPVTSSPTQTPPPRGSHFFPPRKAFLEAKRNVHTF